MNKIIQGDALEVLKTLPNESVDCVVTSPPYWALRDYGVEGQLGLEPTFQEYITKLCDIFDEVRRVLKKGGTCFVNIGDTYGNSGKGASGYSAKSKLHDGRGVSETEKGRKRAKESWSFIKKPAINDKNYAKSLCQIPSRFAIEMCNRGWILRNRIIWWKRNCMPSSVTDRFTVDYEDVFFFAKSKKYYFEQQFEPYVENSDMAYRKTLRLGRKYEVKQPYLNNNPLTYSKTNKVDERGKNKRSVWQVNTKPFKEAHFATYPEALIEPMIKAGCPISGVVLDPFFGAGTTGLVAMKQNKQYLGIELNEKYIEIAQKRLLK